jgi:hypothetical protein
MPPYVAPQPNEWHDRLVEKLHKSTHYDQLRIAQSNPEPLALRLITEALFNLHRGWLNLAEYRRQKEEARNDLVDASARYSRLVANCPALAIYDTADDVEYLYHARGLQSLHAPAPHRRAGVNQRRPNLLEVFNTKGLGEESGIHVFIRIILEVHTGQTRISAATVAGLLEAAHEVETGQEDKVLDLHNLRRRMSRFCRNRPDDVVQMRKTVTRILARTRRIPLKA